MTALAAIRKALETQLLTVTGPDYAFENTSYVPTIGKAYVQVTLLPAQPSNLEMGPGYLEQGIFQANGFFPKDAGSGAIMAWAEQVRAAFPFAASLTSGGVTVNIINTTEIGPARPDDSTFMVPVKVRWQARIGG